MSDEASIDGFVTKSRWVTTVGKVCDQFGGEVQTGPFGSQLHASDYLDDGTPVVMPQDMHEGKIVCDRIARVGPKHVSQLKRHILRAGDIVYSRRGDVTRFAVVTKEEEGWLCGTGSIRIRLNCPEIEVGYVRRYLQQEPVGKWLKHHAKGVTMPNLNTDVIRALPFVYPPLPEQRRIAEVLDRVETLRANRRSALAELDSLIQSIFIDLFGDPATNPEGWPHKKLLELGKVSTGRTPPGAELGMFGGPIPFVTPGDLESDEPVKRNLTAAGAEEVGTVRGGATLVCCIGTIGKMARVRQRSAFNQQINAIEWSEDVDDIYGFSVLRFFKPTIKAWGASTTVPILKKSSFEKLEVPLPPHPLQRKFARRFEVVEKLREKQRAALANLDELFLALQYRAFRGEL